ncbi:hypothetical protein BK809_0003286 [Diplodia seriata]|uniref:Uncharacterized protein n=1 Tax=Diplodia seriata TaxID=420778 RepID=A0A1S8BF22_9PEZI|nr:hypothetical protein BK809_0003286 [Diplodia seriata]
MSSSAEPNIGELTTTFTPASSECFSSLFFARESGKTGINLGFPGTSRSTCLPPDFDWAATRYYSPGLCPSAYSYACSYTTDDVTVATCCPSGWDCRPDRGPNIVLGCITTFAESTNLAIGSYSMNSPTIITGTTTMPIVSGDRAFAFGPIVRRASTDLTWPPATTPASTSLPSSSLSSASTTTGASLATAAVSESPGLSIGAKAGIGVGAAVGGVVVIAALIGAIMLRRKRRRSVASLADVRPEESPQELQGTSLQELPGNRPECKKASEKSAGHASELSA